MQPVRLGLVRHQRRKEQRESDRLGAELAPHRRPVAGIEDEIDRREHGAQPLRQQVLGRHAQGNAGVADLALRAHEPLRERRLGDDERPRDLRRRQPADEAQRQRDLCVGGERRMAAREDQLEPFVGNDRLLVLGQLERAGEQLRLARERLLAPDPVDRAVARGRDDPRARVRGRPVSRPALGGADEGVLYRVLGEVEIAEDAAEDRDAARTLVPVGAGEVVYAPSPSGRRPAAPRPCRSARPESATPSRSPRRASPPRSDRSRRAPLSSLQRAVAHDGVAVPDLHARSCADRLELLCAAQLPGRAEIVSRAGGNRP